MIEMLEWVGLDYDEGPKKNGPHAPYIQSERNDLYTKYANELLEKKHAYRCFCTEERLKEMREYQEKNKKAPMYDRHCLYLSEEEIQKNLDAGMPFVVRQKIPSSETVKYTDLIRGTVSFAAKTLDDQVLLKSDGFPTYHLANVVDDHLMEITHVIRGEEWLPSTPKHIILYQAFGWTPPEFAHIPLLLNKDRSKLSKRQGDVSVEEYIKKGYSREAIINFIAFLGWHPGGSEENEIYSLKELVEHFSLEKVHKAGAIFDIEKLDWVNWQWNRRKYHSTLKDKAQKIDTNVMIENPKKGEFVYKFADAADAEKFFSIRTDLLLEMCGEYIDEKYKKDDTKLKKALVTIEEKILRDPKTAQDHLKFYFEDIDYDLKLLTHEKMRVDYETAAKSLKEIQETFQKFDSFNDVDAIKDTLMKIVEKLDLKNGQVLWPLRAALTGEEFSPGVFEVAFVLGKEAFMERTRKALNRLENAK